MRAAGRGLWSRDATTASLVPLAWRLLLWAAMKIPAILVVNAGSSSLKFALFRTGPKDAAPEQLDAGKFERLSRATDAVPQLLAWLAQRGPLELAAVGHRVVHGGERFSEPAILDEESLAELSRLQALDPEHMPCALALIDALRGAHPSIPHIACFDTAFHHELPTQARLLPIPRRYARMGVRRYGFHGLSYRYLLDELGRVAGPQAAAGRVVLAHLGHGASMAAVRGGHCIDTTMALTPASGLVMGTRSGELDPGLGAQLARLEGMTPDAFAQMANQESGMLGISETSGDVRELLALESSDPRACEALGIFCYQARKWIGALAAALGGIDTLIFSGGIGENAPAIRARICEQLEFLGISLDADANAQSAQVISNAGNRVDVRVMHTNEEAQLARAVMQLVCQTAS